MEKERYTPETTKRIEIIERALKYYTDFKSESINIDRIISPICHCQNDYPTCTVDDGKVCPLYDDTGKCCDGGALDNFHMHFRSTPKHICTKESLELFNNLIKELEDKRQELLDSEKYYGIGDIVAIEDVVGLKMSRYVIACIAFDDVIRINLVNIDTYRVRSNQYHKVEDKDLIPEKVLLEMFGIRNINLIGRAIIKSERTESN